MKGDEIETGAPYSWGRALTADLMRKLFKLWPEMSFVGHLHASSDVQPPVVWVMVGELHANRQGLLQVLRESSA